MNPVQVKITVVYRQARTITIMRAQGQQVPAGSYELAVDGKNASQLQAIAARIAGEAASPDEVFGLAIAHGLIKEVK
jgi:hypothetical protein